MLEFFRKYQRYFFVVITVFVIASFSFFGTYSTFAGGEPEVKDRVVGHAIDGTPLMQRAVMQMARFITTDRDDALSGRGAIPNLCNDGVVRNDFLRTRLANLLVKEYFDELKEDLDSRLSIAKRYRPYAHPDAPFLSAKAIWGHFVPALVTDLDALQGDVELTPATFARLSRLYQCQSQFPAEILRRILVNQHNQFSWLKADQRLSYDDLTLFGFHSISDWFGRDFLDLISQFILNAAITAEQKGYQVSLEEAKGDLIRNFNESINQMGGELNYYDHLRTLGFDERSAVEVWQKVLLFRRYYQDVGEAAFVDRLPFRDFAGFAKESAIVQKYEWPIQLCNAQDLAEFEFYVSHVCPKGKGIPKAVLTPEEVEKKVPELVQTTYQAKVAEIAKKQVALRPSIRQVWEWQLNHWTNLKKKFAYLSNGDTREERFAQLEKLDPKLRAEIDSFSRDQLVDENPSWIEEALAAAPLNDKTWSISGSDPFVFKEEGKVYRVEGFQQIGEKHILTFNEARAILAKLVGKVEGELANEKNPFIIASKEAFSAVQKNPTDPSWVQSGNNLLVDQFKLERKEQSIFRTSQENWMKEQAFMMLPEIWSPIHIAEGNVVFFYLQERKITPDPILDQISVGKETLAADAKAYITEKLLQTIKEKKSITIPLQKEDGDESI